MILSQTQMSVHPNAGWVVFLLDVPLPPRVRADERQYRSRGEGSRGFNFDLHVFPHPAHDTAVRRPTPGGSGEQNEHARPNATGADFFANFPEFLITLAKSPHSYCGEGLMAETSGNIEALVGAHYREVHGLLWALTRNQATADELTQDVFIVAMKKDSVSGVSGMGMVPGDGMRLWLRETARRLAFNEMRRKRPAPLEPQDLNALPGMSVHAGAQDSEDFDDEVAALRQCMSELPEADRKLLSERYSGASIADLAKSSGLSVDYVKLKLFRLRKALGERIRKKVAAST